MVSIVDMLKRSEKFSLAFDRSMPIRFQQQFWQLIAFLDKHDITWFNDEPASDHAMCQQLLGQVWRQDCQDVVLSFETQETRVQVVVLAGEKLSMVASVW